MLVRIAHVEDTFQTPAFKEAAITELERKLRSIHPYYIAPDIGPRAHDERVAAFLEQATQQDLPQGTDEASGDVEREGDPPQAGTPFLPDN